MMPPAAGRPALAARVPTVANELYDVMDLKALRCFWATARHRSLTRAGIELGISEAAVSQRIKSLESYIGTKLYEAKGGRVKLTEAGERALHMAIALFDQVEALQTEVLAGETTGTMRIAAAESVLRYLLPDIVARFTSQFPQAQMRLFSRHSWHCVETVARNEADMGIIPSRTLPDSLIFYPWHVCKACLILPRGHALVRAGTPAIRDLLNETTVMRYPLVSTEEDDPDDQRVQDTLQREGLPYHVRLHVGNLQTVKHYVARGLGIAVVPELCLDEKDHDAIEAIDIPPEFHGETTYGVILRRDKYRTTLISELLELMGIDAGEPPPEGA
jgi:DNA-binding transcriptional LysR family regulator